MENAGNAFSIFFACLEAELVEAGVNRHTWFRQAQPPITRGWACSNYLEAELVEAGLNRHMWFDRLNH